MRLVGAGMVLYLVLIKVGFIGLFLLVLFNHFKAMDWMREGWIRCPVGSALLIESPEQ
ncbi:hypothetical protein D3C76_1838430 [compost metagenome]